MSCGTLPLSPRSPPHLEYGYIPQYSYVSWLTQAFHNLSAHKAFDWMCVERSGEEGKL